MADKVSMLPIVGNLTAELLDEFDPVFVKDLVEWVTSEDEHSEPHTIFDAIAGSQKFIRTLAAAEQSAVLANARKAGQGEKMLMVLCLLAGWKLAEYAMEKKMRETVV